MRVAAFHRATQLVPLQARASQLAPLRQRISSHLGGGGRLLSIETRCSHCHITFATNSELAHHSQHHCFPDAPGEVLRRFPSGMRVTVPHARQPSARRGLVVGPASNPSMAHACVSVLRDNGILADVPLSRLVPCLWPPRLLTETDRPRVAALQLESWLDTYGAQATPEYLETLPTVLEERWRTLRFGLREFALVVEGPPAGDEAPRPESPILRSDAALSGFVTVLDRGDHAWVDNLHVAVAARRSGAGRALMGAAAASTRREGYERIRLTVLESNERARAFYDAIGGREIGRYDVEFVGRQLVAIELEWSDSTLRQLELLAVSVHSGAGDAPVAGST